MTRIEKSFAGFLLLFVVVAAGLVFNRFHLTTDLGAFLPKGESAVERLMVELLDTGASSNLMFIGITGALAEELAAASQALEKRLADSKYIQAIHNSPGNLTEPQQRLIREYRYLLSRQLSSNSMTEKGLRESFNQRMQGLTSPLASLEKKFIRFDPTGEILSIMNEFASQDKDKSSAPRLVDGAWISRSGERSLMILEINATAFDLDGLSGAYNFVFNELSELSENSALEFTITGPGAFAVLIKDTIHDDVRLLSLLATFCVGLFLWLALRSVTMLVMVFVPLACGIISAIAAVLLIFGNINGITLAFGVTLIGVAIDYPIHFFTHLGHGKHDPSKSSLKLIWPTIRLGVLSTVIAYGSLLFSEMPGLQQLGLFTITGLTVAAMATRWILPLLTSDSIALNTGLPRLHHGLERIAIPAFKARWITLGLTVAALIFLVFKDGTIADYDTRSLSPITKAQSKIDRQVRSELGQWSGGNLLLITGKSDQQVLMRLESLSQFMNSLIDKDIISDFTSVASFLPSASLQVQRQSMLPENAVLQENLLTAMNDYPFKPGLFIEFIADVEASKNLEPISRKVLDQYQLGDKVSGLLHQKGSLWYAPVLLYQLSNPDLLRENLAILAADKGWDKEDSSEQRWIHYINLQMQANEIMENALTSMIKLIVIGGFCIYLLLAVNFKDIIRPLKILLPTLLAVALTVFILVVGGISLTVFHIVSLLLVVGLGLDYSLFFHRLTDHKDEWSTTFRALWICCCSTVLVFGLLVISKTPPLHAVGMTVAIGAFLCLILGAMFASHSLRHPQ